MPKQAEDTDRATGLALIANMNTLPSAALRDELTAHLGEGMNDMDAGDFALPFLKIIQALSPEKKRNKPEYLAEAQEGDFVNSVTRELFPREPGVAVVRVAFRKRWLEWLPIDAGGGLLGIYDSAQEAEQKRRPVTGNEKQDSEIVETHEIFCLQLTEHGWKPVVFPWSKSKLPASRRWNGLVADQTARRWKIAESDQPLPASAVVYQLSSVSKTGKKGDYYVPTVRAMCLAPEAAYRAAKNLRQSILGGAVKTSYQQEDITEVEVSAADDVPGAADSVV